MTDACKAHEPRRYKIPRARYKVRNWPEYDRALQQRGSLTVWGTPEALRLSPPRSWAPAGGQRLGKRSGAGAGPTRGRRQVERDRSYSGIAGDPASGRLHRALDAMGCQKDIAAQIRAKGADCLLVLKANHGRAFGLCATSCTIS